jgi:polar amino acid transport system substrate-binding protein
MAASPWRVILVALSSALTVWIWALGTLLFMMRWNSVERPGPPLRELFPYGELRIGVDASFPPYAVATADDLFGLDIDLGVALGRQIGIDVRFVNMGFDGLYDSVKTDQVDMLISALLIDPARTAEVRYTRPYFNNGLVLVSDSSRSIETMPEIAGRSLALEFGSNADAEARLWARRIPPFDLFPYELPQYALDAVRLGEAAGALVEATSARLYFREHPQWQAQYAYVTDAPYAIAIRIDRAETWEAINKALHTLDENGTLDEILRRWL